MNISKQQIYWGLGILAVISLATIVWRVKKSKKGVAQSNIPKIIPISESQYFNNTINEYILIKSYTDKKCISWSTNEAASICNEYKDVIIPIGTVVQAKHYKGMNKPFIYFNGSPLDNITIDFLGLANNNFSSTTNTTSQDNICSPMTGQTQGCGANYKDYMLDENGNKIQIWN